MTLPKHCYGDPSNLVDTLRKLEKHMQGCDKCDHQIVMWGLIGCAIGKQPEEENYCRFWKERG